MAAKLEQSVSPSFNRMVGTLPPLVAEKVTKGDLIDLEFDICQMLEFSLQWASPTLFAERYLKVLGKESLAKVDLITAQFCKFCALKSGICLEFPGSVIGAAAVTLALNVLSFQEASDVFNMKSIPEVSQNYGSPLSWWIKSALKETMLDLNQVSNCYSKLLTQVNESDQVKGELTKV